MRSKYLPAFSKPFYKQIITEILLMGTLADARLWVKINNGYYVHKCKTYNIFSFVGFRLDIFSASFHLSLNNPPANFVQLSRKQFVG